MPLVPGNLPSQLEIVSTGHLQRYFGTDILHSAIIPDVLPNLISLRFYQTYLESVVRIAVVIDVSLCRRLFLQLQLTLTCTVAVALAALSGLKLNEVLGSRWQR